MFDDEKQNLFVLASSVTREPADARTMNFGPDIPFQQYLSQVAGVTHVFSNVFLELVLQGNRGTFSQLASDWRVGVLMRQHFTISQERMTATGTIMHEIMHSLANPNPITDHVKVNGRDANRWKDLITAAMQSNDKRMLGNPQTFVYLAFGAPTSSPFL
jgi:hypothetical protein